MVIFNTERHAPKPKQASTAGYLYPRYPGIHLRHSAPSHPRQVGQRSHGRSSGSGGSWREQLENAGEEELRL